MDAKTRGAGPIDIERWLLGGERWVVARKGLTEAVLQRRYAASVERVWAAFVERDQLRGWFGDVQGELRLGATLRSHVGADFPVTSRVLRCEPPERLCVSWWYEGFPPDAIDEVEVVLTPDGAGTRVELAHRTRNPSELGVGVGPGWEDWSYRLTAWLEGATLPAGFSQELQARALPLWQRVVAAACPPSSPTVTARVRRRFHASPERVFDAWLDPAQLARWMGQAARREGMGELTHVELEARVGGRFRWVYRGARGELVQAGEYLEIARARRLVFSWDIALPDLERVVVDIEPTADGCQVVLEHVMDPAWRGDVSPATAAWAVALEALGIETGAIEAGSLGTEALGTAPDELG